MNFRVQWTEGALAELTQIWLNATDRRAVTQAAHAIDLELENRAPFCGEPRTASQRTMGMVPLWVLYSIETATRTAVVRCVLKLPDCSSS